jgi:hypothetical protein
MKGQNLGPDGRLRIELTLPIDGRAPKGDAMIGLTVMRGSENAFVWVHPVRIQ